MSARTWKTEQLIHLSHRLSDAFLLGQADCQVSGQTDRQWDWLIRSLIQIGKAKLKGSFRRLFRSFIGGHCFRQAAPKAGHEWTTETLIQISEAKAQAFFTR